MENEEDKVQVDPSIQAEVGAAQHEEAAREQAKEDLEKTREEAKEAEEAAKEKAEDQA